MAGPAHSGMYGGAAPDALAALVAMLATLRDDAGDTTVTGLDNTGTWGGADYPADRFARRCAGAARRRAPRVRLGRRHRVGAAGGHRAGDRRAVGRERDGRDPARGQGGGEPPGPARPGRRGSPAPPRGAPRGRRTLGCPGHRRAQDAGPAVRGAHAGAGLRRAGGRHGRGVRRDLVTAGQGGAIPLCNALATAHPDAEILLLGVEEPACHIHAADESVDPGELERTALGVALMLAELGS